MKILSDSDLENFKKFIENHKAFVICGHKEPDGDCIASSLGLAKILDFYKKPYQILNAGPFKRTETKKYEKFFKNQFVRQTNNIDDTGLFIVDCSDSFRLGDMESQVAHLDTFIIDHHKTSTNSSDNSIIDPTSPAAACLVQQLFEKTVGKLDSETASILFFGLSTDTGFFKFLDDKSAEVFILASKLVEAGANPRQTYDAISSGKPFSTRKLLGATLNHTESYFDGKLIISYETMADTHALGAEGRDSDALYSLLLAVENVEAVVFVRQETDKTCTLGFRSRDEVDVSEIATVFGGGGHKNASGACTSGTIETLIPKIKQEFAKIF
ncbi:MAG: bifunctional oligoribonuclease/PAP phosphatase NrnA [Spirochaetaceae bacterium]|nr:bifunctional oligoribonuclease/PAP phosphatase NrnA [Spirochaetaceae bacterium]